MAPIRVGIIGLSATSSWAVRAHLPYLQNSSKYEITGVCNSSAESSQKAIEAHQLSKDTKAYGSVADLAANPDIDLVVCAVRVDRHYECLKPAIEAGKDCFVEWPLASNLEQATELLQLAEAKGVKTMVGLQGQMSPAIKKVKELLDSNAIGRVSSSSTNQATGMYDDVASEHYEYLNFAEFGGNMLVIAFGHLFDSVSYALGELKEISATLSIQQKDVTVMSKEGAIVRTIQRTAADHITTSGLLSTGAHSSATVRGRGPMKGEPGLIWQIEGDKGIIDIRSESAFGVSISAELKIRLQDFANGEVREIEVADDQPGAPGNIGRLYEAFAEGKGYPDWKWAVKRHAWVEAVYESARTGKKVAYV